ncbi:hypothetical protein HC752_07125 [Vibrio sp. S9_S30]|uniref:hypothetical protein n=1 Tax=Vibrio sp. S9_S30 TaxID=2720226 RepID=UPI001681199E|nr:hypothetical protein [Vibrio sp. S9_S30]MBD1556703.1 hypothetical protein [Vibrio sp. S9_S30]
MNPTPIRTCEGRKDVVLGILSRSTVTIPTFGLCYDRAKQWFDELAHAAINASLNVTVMNRTVKTHNLIAETRRGNDEQVVMLGLRIGVSHWVNYLSAQKTQIGRSPISIPTALLAGIFCLIELFAPDLCKEFYHWVWECIR